ncbi:uncharacterized protein METZ01_LOCUS234180 [marine metagenome]|uniref:Uncharacterized protein n=1 Tax=marine metagenome TaxID=408172 RepID=A0A382H1Z1_9ZZZZ
MGSQGGGSESIHKVSAWLDGVDVAKL